MVSFKHSSFLLSYVFHLFWMLIKGYTISSIYTDNKSTMNNICWSLYITSMVLSSVGTTFQAIVLRYSNRIVFIAGSLYHVILILLEFAILIMTVMSTESLESSYFADVPFLATIVSVQQAMISAFFLVIKFRLQKMAAKKKKLL